MPTTSEIKIKTEKEAQKQFQSIDHNIIMGNQENGPENHEMANGARKDRVMTKEEIRMEKDFNNQISQNFANNKKSKGHQNAFHHRREQSANP